MQRFIGRVIGTANRKTAKVCVMRQVKHPKYHNIMNLKKNYMVHDEKEATVIGDLVAIQQCEKMSPRKYFTLLKIVKEARIYKDPKTGETYTSA